MKAFYNLFQWGKRFVNNPIPPRILLKRNSFLCFLSCGALFIRLKLKPKAVFFFLFFFLKLLFQFCCFFFVLIYFCWSFSAFTPSLDGLGPNVQNVATAVEQVYPLLFECQKPRCKWNDTRLRTRAIEYSKRTKKHLILGIACFGFITMWQQPQTSELIHRLGLEYHTCNVLKCPRYFLQNFNVVVELLGSCDFNSLNLQMSSKLNILQQAPVLLTWQWRGRKLFAVAYLLLDVSAWTVKDHFETI